ncbi:YbaN family protein [Microvirga brassicacearum]|uniref:YbaN family protein n=1 Tax=Microvirga brassicacearum TaxID=2580413 RepID=UPI001FCE67DA|nr:YbaN family protein [Microvirga brassicacearum]
MRWLHLCLGYASVSLAVLGLILPLLPSTPFVLLAVWLFARSDPQYAARLYSHPRFGSLLSNWRDEGAIALPAKTSAVGALSLSYAMIL